MVTKETESLEVMAATLPMGWVKLPSGESFAIADVVVLGEIQEERDNQIGRGTFYFSITLGKDSYGLSLNCSLDDTDFSGTRSQLERFRDQIAIARWGEHCVEMKMEES